MLWPVERLTLAYLGTTVHPAFVAYAAPRVDAAARAEMLSAWRDRLGALLAGPAGGTGIND
ncbi:hypothetical protein PQJ75_00285 [Rhodoplanes sp. TEM]|uniref:Flavodoxin-like fold domain-containing protein n=1 Tax=Rhodoplanes tepidamans TaxID=200616 RepID=A0ABT5J4X0_RHOTP|nr:MULTISPECIES: hypothetical protein [Rhodoplanes]MDC7784689.1 hypothetical protein [Rhodoplanes tepidamans]MDC7982156.1 hypothetical protein [Rhodoplanes sp. TEM]MDQ0356160.1 putative NADPH-quinone reductase [Rhodoplanes tepidamans]